MHNIASPPFTSENRFMLVRFQVLVLFVAVFLQGVLPLMEDGLCGANLESDNKVVNGDEAELKEFPWMALLVYEAGDDLVFSCGGSLIHRRYVLTAAHCVSGILGAPIFVRLGEHDIRTEPDCVESGFDEVCNEASQDLKVDRCIPHPSRCKYFHDIALLRLSYSANFTDSISPICLPPSNLHLQPGQELTVAGWGNTENGTGSPVKRKAKVPLVDKNTCMRCSEAHICAGGNTQDSCSGDSGGPLMHFDSGVWYVAGIVSFGPKKCGSIGLPGVYVNVSHYIDWIEEELRNG